MSSGYLGLRFQRERSACAESGALVPFAFGERRRTAREMRISRVLHHRCILKCCFQQHERCAEILGASTYLVLKLRSCLRKFLS